jgi:hypothetical protein
MFTDLVNKWAMLNGKLTAKARSKIKPENFALSGGRYPIENPSHARAALSRVSEFGTPEEKAIVRAKAAKKYPSIGNSGECEDVMLNGGPGSGRHKESSAFATGQNAETLTKKAFKTGKPKDHVAAQYAHKAAATHYRDEMNSMLGSKTNAMGRIAYHMGRARLHSEEAGDPSFRNSSTKIGQITYDHQGRITNFIPASILNAAKPAFASTIERFKKSPVMANNAPNPAKLKNDSTSPIDASDDAMLNDDAMPAPQAPSMPAPITSPDTEIMNKDVPLAKPVTDPKQATVEEQKSDLKKADEQKAIVNSGTSEGVNKEWITRKGNGSMNVPEGKIHVNHDAATDHLSIVSEDHSGNRTSQFDQKLDRSAEGKDRTPPTVSYHPESKTIKVQTPKTLQWESGADWSGSAKLSNAQRIVGKAVEIKGERLSNSAFKADPSGWMHLSPVGEYENANAGVTQVLSPSSHSQMVAAFNSQRAVDPNHMIILDFDHSSDTTPNTAAAGWIDALRNDASGLWGHAKLTPEGDRAVSSGTYRFVSPVFTRAMCLQDGTPDRLIPQELSAVALTNKPNLPVKALSV